MVKGFRRSHNYHIILLPPGYILIWVKYPLEFYITQKFKKVTYHFIILKLWIKMVLCFGKIFLV